MQCFCEKFCFHLPAYLEGFPSEHGQSLTRLQKPIYVLISLFPILDVGGTLAQFLCYLSSTQVILNLVHIHSEMTLLLSSLLSRSTSWLSLISCI